MIDIKAELAEVRANVKLYNHIKTSTIHIMQLFPKANVEVVVTHLCEDNQMSQEDFNFICEVERMMFEDMIGSYKYPRNPKSPRSKQ